MTLTTLALLLTIVEPLGVAFYASSIPRNRPPGTTAPLLVLLLTYYAAWFAYLTRVIAKP